MKFFDLTLGLGHGKLPKSADEYDPFETVEGHMSTEKRTEKNTGKNPNAKPPRPGKILGEVLDEIQMSQAELCTRTGRSRKLINEIIKGKAQIAPETAYHLELTLGRPAADWMRLEGEYQTHRVARRSDEELAKQLSWLDELPVEAMIRAKWIEREATPLDQARALLKWFGVVSPQQWREVYRDPQETIRFSPAFDSEPGALSAWLRAGEKQALEMATPPYDRKKFQRALSEIRGLTREPPTVYQDRMIELSIASGVAVAFARELPGLAVAGASRWLSPRKALIQLSLLHGTDADLWFTFFHEAAHILLHGRKMVFVEGVVDGKPARDDVLEEVEADHWVGNFLLPEADLEELRPQGKRRIRRKAVVDFAKRHGVAPGIVVLRLQHLGWIAPVELDGLKTPMEWAKPGTYVEL